ncbi:putative Glycosyl transferase group 1 [Nitrospira moscoviensis]|uniref:Putative Glycosyl transferase group 1 n=2 Tax=Nitrospira moscoviensis TaxID=42253 RepID=A0A0K2GG46_NITMO|nr:putative Glycosyl transferase group 1 [Nitrospira moscoviensis]
MMEPRKTPTVVFIHGVAAIGGAERELLLYVERLPQHGLTPIVICPPDGALSAELRMRRAPVHAAEFPPWRKWTTMFRRRRAVRQLAMMLERLNPDVVHVNDIWWVPQTMLAVNGMNLPVIAHVRQEIEPPKVSRYRLNHAGLVLAVSRQIEESIKASGIDAARVRTLYSGLDLPPGALACDRQAVRRQLSIPPDALLLGTVANLFERKGYDVMLAALARVVKTEPSVQYVIVGTGDPAYERALRSQVQALELSRHVQFAGFQDPVYPYIAAMDLYVQPSRMEGFGIAVIEAMAMGKAVIGTATGGLPEVIVHEETGLLVPPDDPGALAEAVRVLLKNLEKRERFARAGQDRAKTHFTIDAMMQGLTSAYAAIAPVAPIAAEGDRA